MAETDQKVSVLFGVNLGNLPAGMQQAQAAVQSATAGMNAALSGVGAAMHGIMGPLAALTGVLAGGAVFKRAIDASQEWNLTAGKMAKQMGTTTEKASVMMVAVQHLGITTETFQRAVSGMGRQLAAGGEGFERLGLRTKESNGQLKPMAQLMDEANAKIRSIGNATEQNAAGLAIYGRAWPEVRKVIGLTGEAMEEARLRAEKLHLIVGPDAEGKAKAYKAAMQDVKLVSEAVMIAIGNKLVPVLTQLSNWFTDNGPTAVDGFVEFLKGLAAAFLIVKAVIENVWDSIKMFFEMGGRGLAALAAAASLALQGKFSEAKEALVLGAQDIKKAHAAAAKSIEDSWTNAWGAVTKLWYPGAPKKGKEEKGDGKLEDKSADRMKKWETELSEARASAGLKWGPEQEMVFWRKRISEAMKGTDLYLSIKKKLNDLSLTLAKANWDEELAGYRQFMSLYKDDQDVQLGFTQQIAERTAEVFGTQRKEHQDALRELERIEKDSNERRAKSQSKSIQDMAELRAKELDAQTAQTKNLAAMGLMSPGEEIDRLQAIEDEKFRIRQEAAANQLDLEGLTNEERLAIVERFTQQMQEHEATTAELSGQRMKASVEQIRGFIGGVLDSVSSSIQGMLTGVSSFADGVKNIFRSLLGSVVKFFVDMAAAWIKQQLLMLIFGKTAAATEQATEAAATAAKIASNVAQTTSNAGVAGSEAAAAVAGIPIAGPLLAMQAMAMVSGAIMSSMVPLAAAAGGFDVGNFAPLTQLHAREMVLPAHIADPLRESIANGSVGGGGAPITFHVSAIDAKGVEQFFRSNDKALVKQIRESIRSGRL